jgi:hypothetical protein
MIRRLLEEHNDLCQQISNYNKYWKKYLTIAYSIFLSIICVLTYVTLIYSGLKWFLRIEYLVILSAHSLLIYIITYSAASISDFNLILYKDLHSICAKNCFPIDIKIKVRFIKNLNNKMKKKFKNLFQLTNCIQKLGDNKIGFTLTNGVLITRSSFQFVSRINIIYK